MWRIVGVTTDFVLYFEAWDEDRKVENYAATGDRSEDLSIERPTR